MATRRQASEVPAVNQGESALHYYLVQYKMHLHTGEDIKAWSSVLEVVRNEDEAGAHDFSPLPFIGVRSQNDIFHSLASANGVSAVHHATQGLVRVVEGLHEALRPHRYSSDQDTNESLGYLAAINMSLGTDDLVEYDTSDPVNVATRVASQTAPIVAAAGNVGRAPDGAETLSAWAQAPWVISVGASTAEDGGSIARYSSVGDKNDPSTWPTIVAYGASALDHSRRGTSYAAPRVTRQIAALTALCLTLRASYGFLRSEETALIRVPRVFFIDCDIHSSPPPLTILALPRSGVDVEALARTFSIAADAGLSLTLEPNPASVRQLLISSAIPLPKVEGHQARYGFVNDDTTLNYLNSFSGLDIVIAFGAAAQQIRPDVQRQLRDLPILVPSGIEQLLNVWYTSIEVDPFDLGGNCLDENVTGFEALEVFRQG